MLFRSAASSSVKYSAVAPKAIREAFLAWTKGSLRDLVKAAIRTFDRDEVPRCLAIFPRQMVVFVRIPGCSSFAVLASCLSRSPLIVRSESFVMMTSTDFRVCSLTTGVTSVKPVVYVVSVIRRVSHEELTSCGKILSLTIFCDS